MDTTNLIKSVIQENVLEAKKIASDLLLQKLSEKLQSKFEEYAPASFLDEEEEVIEEELELVNEKKEKEEEEEEAEEEDEKDEEDEEEEDEEDEDEEEEDEEEMGEDGLVYEDDCENCNHDNNADEMNKKAFGKHGISEELKGKQHELDVAEPKGKLTGADFKKLGEMRKKKKLSEESEQLDEVSPPGMKKMTHSKKATKSFKSQYGKRGKSVQYATAWKKSKKDE